MNAPKNSYLSYFPSIAGGIIVGGVVLASGGAELASGVALLATSASGIASGELLDKRRKNEFTQTISERDRLRERVKEQIKSLEMVVEIEQLQKWKEGLNQDITTLSSKNDHLAQKKEALEQRIQQIQKANPDLKALEQRLAQSQALQTHIGQFRGELEAIQSQIKQKEEQRDRLQEVSAQFIQKQVAVEELNDRLRDLNSQAVELEVFRSTYDALQQEFQKLQAQKQHLEADIPRLQQEQNRIQTEIQTIEDKAQQANILHREIEDLKQEIRVLKGRCFSLKQEIEGLEADQSRIGSEITKLKNKRAELKAEIDELKGEIKEIKNSAKQAFEALQKPIEDIKAITPKSSSDETVFLKDFKSYLQQNGLDFSERIINAFHTSLKVQDISALVILAGISGTGKSELPQAYAEFIGAPLVMLPVQPRWDSPQDLQGFYNYIEKKYKPTDLMHYLYQYQHQQETFKDRIVMVLLDEMNLAKVEYYFSDFLSKLESRRNKPTFLDIDAGSIALDKKERKILIPEEFLFIGTMNEDETTQSLSDKVLDRANVLTFGRPQELKLRDKIHNQNRANIPEQYVTWANFNGWTKNPQSSDPLVEQIKVYVDQANKIMESLGHPFAHRVYQAIAKYVVNYPNVNVSQDDTIFHQAIADQFGQKLLPKLRGVMVEDHKDELKDMENLIRKFGDQALIEAFEKACKGQYGQFQWKGMIYKEDKV